MPRDIRLYAATGRFLKDTTSELTESSPLESVSATRIEVLGNKVTKYLLTTRGSDALDPSYGGTAMTTTQMSRDHLPKFRLELEHDIKRCNAYIKSSEMNLDLDEKLSLVVLRDVQYNPELDPTSIHVYIEIRTTKGNQALLDIRKPA